MCFDYTDYQTNANSPTPAFDYPIGATPSTALSTRWENLTSNPTNARNKNFEYLALGTVYNFDNGAFSPTEFYASPFSPVLRGIGSPWEMLRGTVPVANSILTPWEFLFGPNVFDFAGENFSFTEFDATLGFQISQALGVPWEAFGTVISKPALTVFEVLGSLAIAFQGNAFQNLLLDGISGFQTLSLSIAQLFGSPWEVLKNPGPVRGINWENKAIFNILKSANWEEVLARSNKSGTNFEKLLGLIKTAKPNFEVISPVHSVLNSYLTPWESLGVLKRLFGTVWEKLIGVFSPLGVLLKIQTAADTFTESNQNPLPPTKWTTATAFTPLQIIGGVCEATTVRSVSRSAELYTGYSWTPNQWARVQIANLAGGGGFRILVRSSRDGLTCYSVEFVRDIFLLNAIDLTVNVYVNGVVVVTLGLETTFGYSNGDVFEVQILDNQIKVLQNGAQVFVSQTIDWIASGGLGLLIDTDFLPNTQLVNFVAGQLALSPAHNHETIQKLLVVGSHDWEDTAFLVPKEPTPFEKLIGVFSPQGSIGFLQQANDTFTGADQSPVNPAKWTPIPGFANLQVLGHVCEGTDSLSAELYTGITWSPNQWAEVKINNLFGDGGVNILLRAGLDAATGDYYDVQVFSNGDGTFSLEVTLFLGGNPDDVLISIDPVTFVNGDTIRAAIVGNRITVYRNGNVIASAIDPANSVLSGGVALFLATDAGQLTQAQVTNFVGGSFVIAPGENFEIVQGNVVRESTFWEDVKGFTLFKGIPFENIARLVMLRKIDFEALTTTRTKVNINWENLKKLLVQRSTDWEYLSKFISVKATDFEITGGRRNSFINPWEEMGGVKSFKGTDWEDLSASLPVLNFYKTQFEAKGVVANRLGTNQEWTKILAILSKVNEESIKTLSVSRNTNFEMIRSLQTFSKTFHESGGVLKQTFATNFEFLATSIRNTKNTPFEIQALARQIERTFYEAFGSLTAIAGINWEATSPIFIVFGLQNIQALNQVLISSINVIEGLIEQVLEIGNIRIGGSQD